LYLCKVRNLRSNLFSVFGFNIFWAAAAQVRIHGRSQ
jgi:hypothetical protein